MIDKQYRRPTLISNLVDDVDDDGCMWEGCVCECWHKCAMAFL